MSDTVTKYWEEQENLDFAEYEARGLKEIEEYSQDVINIKELFRLLSLEDKILVKKIISLEKVF